MNSYSKVIRTFISSIVGFALISSPSLALNSNFHQEDSNNVQNNINPVEKQINLLHSTFCTLQYVSDMIQSGDQSVANTIFDSLNAVVENLNNIDYQVLEEYFAEEDDDSSLENIESIIQELRYSEENVCNLYNYFCGYDQNICYTLDQICYNLCYIDSWIANHIVNEINNISNELISNLFEEEFYNR